MQNGKGDAPRNCFSKAYKDNFDDIFRKPGHKSVDISKWQKKSKEDLELIPFLEILETKSFAEGIQEITRKFMADSSNS